MKRGLVIPLFFVGCVTLFPYDAFIDSMDTVIGNSQRMKTTIDDYLNADPDLSKELLVKQEDAGVHLILHYAQPMPWGGICYYHVIVDKKTRLLIGWGFDEDKGDPKVCGFAG